MIEKNTRKLFQAWLRTPDGGAHVGRVPESYGTYVQQSRYDGLVANVFKADGVEILDAKDLEDLRSKINYSRVVLTDAMISERARFSNVKAGLCAFGKFLVWLLDYYPLARTFSQCWELIEAAGPIGIGKNDTVEGKCNLKKQKKTAKPSRVADIMDSYEQLFNHFAKEKFTPANLYKFGLEKSIYADRIGMEDVAQQFKLLIRLLESGTWGDMNSHGRTRKNLHIRKYSGDKTKSKLYVELYGKVFPNVKIVVEDSGNTAPKENLKQITRCQPFSQGEGACNMQLFLKNFQCSHVIDNRTKNPLLFEAVWNVVFTPKIIDPFTGHETLGRWPAEFQPRFRNEIRRRFSSQIELFNEVAKEYQERIRNAAEEVANDHEELDATERERFIADAIAQWEPINCANEEEPEIR